MLLQVAVKIMDINKITEDYVIKNLYREGKLMAKLNHPNITSLFETMQVRFRNFTNPFTLSEYLSVLMILFIYALTTLYMYSLGLGLHICMYLYIFYNLHNHLSKFLTTNTVWIG